MRRRDARVRPGHAAGDGRPLTEQPAERAVVFEERIGVADREHDVDFTQPVQPPLIVQAAQDMRGRVEVDVLVVIPVEQISDMLDLQRQNVATRKGDELAEEMRMAEHQIGRLERAETAAHRDRAIVRIDRRHQRRHLVQQVVLEYSVAVDVIGGMAAASVEALGGQTFDAEQQQLPGIDLAGQAGHDAELLVFPEPAVPRGKHQHLGAGMAEHQELHVAVGPRAVPAPVVSPHATLKNSLTRAASTACCACMPS